MARGLEEIQVLKTSSQTVENQVEDFEELLFNAVFIDDDINQARAAILNLNADAINDIRNTEEQTLLHGAAQKGNVEMVQLLLDYGANNFDKKDDFGQFAFCYSDDLNIIELLVTNNNINSPDNIENSPLINFVLQDNYQAVDLLLRKNALINHQGYQRKTALYYAKTVEITERLLSCEDIDINLKDEDGNNAFASRILNNKLPKSERDCLHNTLFYNFIRTIAADDRLNFEDSVKFQGEEYSNIMKAAMVMQRSQYVGSASKGKSRKRASSIQTPEIWKEETIAFIDEAFFQQSVRKILKEGEKPTGLLEAIAFAKAIREGDKNEIEILISSGITDFSVSFRGFGPEGEVADLGILDMAKRKQSDLGEELFGRIDFIFNNYQLPMASVSIIDSDKLWDIEKDRKSEGSDYQI